MAGMTRDVVKIKLHETLDMTSSEYLYFWQRVKDARDKFLVHNDFTFEDRPTFPDTNHLLRTCLVMRDIVADIIAAESFEDVKRHGEIQCFVEHYTNERLLSEVNRDVARLSQAVGK